MCRNQISSFSKMMCVLEDAKNFDLNDHIVPGLPNSAYYVPNFITEKEEKFMLQQISNSPKVKWKSLGDRRLQNWGGLPHHKGMIQETLPNWTNTYLDRITKTGVFKEKNPNHILLNEYLPGQGIMPHEDGPLFHPTITTINLGSHTVIDFYNMIDDDDDQKKLDLESRHIGSLLLERRSLLILQENMYTKYLHGIKELKEDVIGEKICNLSKCVECELGTVISRQIRYSLTIRHFPKVLKVKLRL